VLTALGMRMAGRAMCRRLARSFGTMQALLDASVEALQRVEGVGPERAVTIAAELADYRPVIEKMAARGVNMTEPEAEVPAELPLRRPDGTPMRVVVTGAIPGLTRTEGNEAVERLGGTSAGSVSAKTDLVVVGEGAGSKAAKAAELGVRTMAADEFAALLAEQSS
jgi:DNA ligase (NAD+)